MPSIGLLTRSLWHYTPTQLWSYGVRRLIGPKLDSRPAPPCRTPLRRIVIGIERPFSEKSPNLFRLLNVDHSITIPSDWNSKIFERLWLYTLHYHEWLSADHSHAKDQSRLIEKWINENPPPVGVGWDPYPTSLRTVQWIKWLARGEAAVEKMLDSMALQVRYLRRTLETHLGANHLLANAMALTAAGLFFEGDEADGWRRSGTEILAHELSKQFGADGGHFELSPSYHALLVEGLLDLENLANSYGPFTRPWSDVLPRALTWMKVMTRSDGTFAQFNDCAQGVAPTSAQIEAYAIAVGLEPQRIPSLQVINLSDTGYARLRDGRIDVIVDAGPFAPATQPGHGHCDMLSFELSVDGRCLILNRGTSTYEQSPRRHSERSTASHNTVQIGDSEQSEIWGAFRAGRTAKITERTVQTNGIAASHDGYRQFGVRHRRTFRLAADALVITDNLLGPTPAQPQIARIHFAPDIMPKCSGGTILAGPLTIATRGAANVRVCDYEYSPEFNLRIPAKVLEIEFTKTLETMIHSS